MISKDGLSPIVEGQFRIMPQDIDPTRHFLSAFGMGEPENEALGVVLYCQAQGAWVSFTQAELSAYFNQAAAEGKRFPFTSQFAAMHAQVRAVSGQAPMSGPDDATDYFMTKGKCNLLFLSTSGGRLIREGQDGRWRVTELFIERCYESSPAQR